MTAPPAGPRIADLRLTDYRNHPTVTVDVGDARFIVLIGDNGAGKTNILEAISLLSPGRGLRRARFDEVARVGGPGSWSVFVTLVPTDGGPEHAIGTGRILTADGPEKARRVRIDGEQARTSDVLLDHLRVLWLTPAMDGLFTGPEADRRRVLDRMVLGIDPRHGQRVNAFETAMRGRNRLLEQGSRDQAWMSAIEAEMAPLGVAIAAARRELIAQLQRMIDGEEASADIFPRADLALTGEIDGLLAEANAAADAEDAYLASLGDSREHDRAAGRTLVGPHRTALTVVHRQKGMPAVKCSTGEQKSLLLGLVLAHAELVARISGQAPILLLDEITAHLDRHRRTALFERLDRLRGQVWMTGTDQAPFADLPGSTARFEICAGSMTAIH